MKRILTLRDYVNDRLRIDERGARFSIPEFNRMIPLVQGTYYDFLIGEYESTLTLSNILNKFVSVQTAQINGILTLTTDYYKTVCMERLDDGEYRRCDLYTLKEWGARLKDSTEPPSDISPMARLIGSKIEVLPAIGSVKHYYFRKLAVPYIAYNTVNEETVIDEQNTVDIEFEDTASFDRIANMILTKIGTSINDANIVATASKNM